MPKRLFSLDAIHAGFSLRAVREILAAAKLKGCDRGPLSEEFRERWRKHLLKTAAILGSSDEREIQRTGSVVLTGVSVVARGGYFYTAYYLPGKADNVIKKSTRVPLNGMSPPMNTKGQPEVRLNPLWWWDSLQCIEILEKVEAAIIERFTTHGESLLKIEAQRIALAAWRSVEFSLSDFALFNSTSEIGEERTNKNDEELGFDSTLLTWYAPAFAEYGIDIRKMLGQLIISGAKTIKK